MHLSDFGNNCSLHIAKIKLDFPFYTWGGHTPIYGMGWWNTSPWMGWGGRPPHPTPPPSMGGGRPHHPTPIYGGGRPHHTTPIYGVGWWNIPPYNQLLLVSPKYALLNLYIFEHKFLSPHMNRY